MIRFIVTKLRRSAGFILAIVTALLVGGVTTAAVMAAIPDSNGIIHGCRNNNRGTLRVIDDTTATCLSDETPLNWSSGSNGTGSKLSIVSNQLQLQGTDGGGGIAQDMDLLTIPGFGKVVVRAGACSGYYESPTNSTSPATFGYVNNTSETITDAPNLYIFNPGDTFNNQDTLGGTQLSYTGSDGISHVANIAATVTVDSTNYPSLVCTVKAQAILF